MDRAYKGGLGFVALDSKRSEEEYEGTAHATVNKTDDGN